MDIANVRCGEGKGKKNTQGANKAKFTPVFSKDEIEPPIGPEAFAAYRVCYTYVIYSFHKISSISVYNFGDLH